MPLAGGFGKGCRPGPRPAFRSGRPLPGGQANSGQRQTAYDRSLMSAVVIGNGIAGVTAADFLRRGHPYCEIHLVGSESQVLYNRMGIYRLVYGRSAMRGLYLLDESWYDEHDIAAWLNTYPTDLHPSLHPLPLAPPYLP